MKYSSNLIDYLNEFKKDFPKHQAKITIIDSNKDFDTECSFVRGYSFCLLFENDDYEIPLYWFNLKYPTKSDFDNHRGLLADSMRAFIPDDEDMHKALNDYFEFEIDDIIELIKDFRSQKQLVSLKDI